MSAKFDRDAFLAEVAKFALDEDQEAFILRLADETDPKKIANIFSDGRREFAMEGCFDDIPWQLTQLLIEEEYGGRENEDYVVVIRHIPTDTLYRLVGSYDSWNGTEFYNYAWAQVEKYEKTVTDYRVVKSK